MQNKTRACDRQKQKEFSIMKENLVKNKFYDLQEREKHVTTYKKREKPVQPWLHDLTLSQGGHDLQMQRIDRNLNNNTQRFPYA